LRRDVEPQQQRSGSHQRAHAISIDRRSGAGLIALKCRLA
jgi:hypothetical protein